MTQLSPHLNCEALLSLLFLIVFIVLGIIWLITLLIQKQSQYQLAHKVFGIVSIMTLEAVSAITAISIGKTILFVSVMRVQTVTSESIHFITSAFFELETVEDL